MGRSAPLAIAGFGEPLAFVGVGGPNAGLLELLGCLFSLDCRPILEAASRSARFGALCGLEEEDAMAGDLLASVTAALGHDCAIIEVGNHFARGLVAVVAWVCGLSTRSSWKVPKSGPIELSSFRSEKATPPKCGD